VDPVQERDQLSPALLVLDRVSDQRRVDHIALPCIIARA
jgi:hypothetical protein